MQIINDFSVLDLGTLSMSAISCVVSCDCSQLMSWFDHYQFQLVYLTIETLSKEKSPAWNYWHVWPVSAPSPFIAQIFFFAVQLYFYLSWNNKAQYVKMLLLSFIFNTNMATQKFKNFDFFKMHANFMSQSYKTVLNEVKDIEVLY